MKALQAIPAWDDGVKPEEDRKSDADTCRILGCAGGSPHSRERGLLPVLWLLPKSPRAVSVPAVIASLWFLADCSRGCLLSCPSAFHIPSKSNVMHTVAAGHR